MQSRSLNRPPEDGRLIPDALLQKVFETIKEGVVLLDRRGRYIAANPAAYRILGLTPGQLLGREALDSRWRTIREDGSPYPTEEYPALVSLRTGESVAGVVMGVYRPDGSLAWVLINTQIIGAASALDRHVLVSFIDVTVVKAAERRLRDLIDAIPAAITLVDRDLRMLVVNRYVADMFAVPVSQIEGRIVPEFLTGPRREKHGALANTCLSGKECEYDETLIYPNGRVSHTQGRYVPIHEGDAVTGYVVAALDVSDLKTARDELARKNTELAAKMEAVSALQAKLLEQSIRDGLTGLYNRRYLDETLPRELANALRKQRSVCVAMADLDHFKSINDTYGHPAGDEMIRQCAEILKQSCRAGDLICRYGGEEFAIVMSETSLDDARVRAEQIRAAFDALHLTYAGRTLHSTVSIGIAILPGNGDTAEAIVHAADRALYEAKGAGRNLVMVCPA